MSNEPLNVAKSEEQHPRAGRTVLLLLLLFCVGIASTVLINELFSRLEQQLGRKGNNERSRQFIAEDISRTVTALELDFLRMATSTNLHRQQMIQQTIAEHLKRIRHALEVLQKGGNFKQQIGLNLEGVDEMSRQVAYQADPEDNTNLLAIIELEPHLELITQKSELALKKLESREKARDSGSISRLSAAELETKLFFKETASLFVRLHENTNRLFHESTTRIEQLERIHAEQRSRYQTSHTVLVGMIILTVLVVGGLLGRQISNITRRLQQANYDLQLSSQAAEAALNLSREAEYEICLRLGRAAEFRDLETGQHTRRISEMASAWQGWLALTWK